MIVNFQVYDRRTYKAIPNAQLQAFWELRDSSKNVINRDSITLFTNDQGIAIWNIPTPQLQEGYLLIVGAFCYAQGYYSGYRYNTFATGNTIPSFNTINIPMEPLTQPQLTSKLSSIFIGSALIIGLLLFGLFRKRRK